MQKKLAEQLMEAALKTANAMSVSTRDYNHNQETFKIEAIRPLSDRTAAVYYQKNPSGKLALGFFFFVKDSWWHIFPTDSHILGMQKLIDLKAEMEYRNWDKNFEEGG
jgi:hypothetical protein